MLHRKSESAHLPVLPAFWTEHPLNVSTRVHNWKQDSYHRLDQAKWRQKNQRRRRPRNPSRNVASHRAVVKMIPTLELIETVAEFTVTPSINFDKSSRSKYEYLQRLASPALRTASTELFRGTRHRDLDGEERSRVEKSSCKSARDKIVALVAAECNGSAAHGEAAVPARRMFSSSQITRLSRTI